MKIFFIIIIFALLVLCGWVRYVSVRPTEAHRSIISGLKIELKESRAEYDDSMEALASANQEINDLKQRLALFQGDAGGSFPAQVTSIGAAPSTVGANVPKSTARTLDEKLYELRGTYEAHRLSIDGRKTQLQEELNLIKSRRESVAATELHFSEQSVQVNEDGSPSGNRGVRTSNADRARAQGKLADKIMEVDREIAKKQTEINQVVREMDALRDNYARAIERAKADFGPGGAPSSGN